MTSVLVMASPGAATPPLEQDLRLVGLQVVERADCASLVHLTVKSAPDVVVCFEQHPNELLFATLTALTATAPRPVLVFTPDIDAENISKATSCGVSAYVVNGYARSRLRPLVHLAQARFEREQTLRAELAAVRQQFSERKLVDRAKGILMGARRLREDEAFRTLRSAAMSAKQRIGQVSQVVIDSAHYAEAMNRAGQLRMLSQRLVKLYALGCAPNPPESAAALFTGSMAQVDANLAMLSRSLSKPTFGDLLEAVTGPWTRMRAALRAPSVVSRLREVDQLGEALLARAEDLTANLEHAAFARALRAINVAGRQRMLSQRLAKSALIAALTPQDAVPATRAMNAAVSELEAGFVYLRALPLTNPKINGELAAALTIWGDYQAALQTPETERGRATIAALSEALLAHFDAMTDELERGMHELMGAAVPLSDADMGAV